MVDFGDKMKSLRTAAGFTQDTLARRLGVTKTVISYYERRERYPSPDVLVRLARVFHVSTDYLLGISHRQTIDVSDLSEEDVALLISVAEALRRKR